MLLERWLRSRGFAWPTTSSEFLVKVLAWCIEHPEHSVCASSVQNVLTAIVMQAATLNACYPVQLYRQQLHDGVQGCFIVPGLPDIRVDLAIYNHLV